MGEGEGVGTRGTCPQNGLRDAVWEKAVWEDWGPVGGVVLLLGLSGSLGEQGGLDVSLKLRARCG